MNLDISTIENISIICMFIIPGFIINGLIKLFIPSHKRSETTNLLYYLLYSIIHCGVFSFIYIPVWKKYYDCCKLLFYLLTFITTFFCSFVLGMIIGIFKKNRILRKILNYFHCNINDEIPTAWDYFFSKQEPFYVIITLIDNSEIYGLYGSNSFASSEPEDRDIYIEKLFEIDEESFKWIENKQSKGIIIKENQIKTIEFLKGSEKNEQTNE